MLQPRRLHRGSDRQRARADNPGLRDRRRGRRLHGSLPRGRRSPGSPRRGRNSSPPRTAACLPLGTGRLDTRRVSSSVRWTRMTSSRQPGSTRRCVCWTIGRTSRSSPIGSKPLVTSDGPGCRSAAICRRCWRATRSMAPRWCGATPLNRSAAMTNPCARAARIGTCGCGWWKAGGRAPSFLRSCFTTGDALIR